MSWTGVVIKVAILEGSNLCKTHGTFGGLVFIMTPCWTSQFVTPEAPLGSIFGAVCGGHVADFMAYLLPRHLKTKTWQVEIRDETGLQVDSLKNVFLETSTTCRLIPKKGSKQTLTVAAFFGFVAGMDESFSAKQVTSPKSGSCSRPLSHSSDFTTKLQKKLYNSGLFKRCSISLYHESVGICLWLVGWSRFLYFLTGISFNTEVLTEPPRSRVVSDLVGLVGLHVKFLRCSYLVVGLSKMLVPLGDTIFCFICFSFFLRRDILIKTPEKSVASVSCCATFGGQRITASSFTGAMPCHVQFSNWMVLLQFGFQAFEPSISTGAVTS